MGKLEIVPNEYSFSSLLNDVLSIVRTKLLDSHLRFVVNVESSIPARLYGDEIRIRQILINLLSNAIKYTDEGFVSLSVRGEIADEENLILHIDVTDSGRGIKKEDVGKLFGDFVQIDLSSNRGIEGTGLGLAITHNIIKEKGGSIHVHSEYGKGSTFTVTLPQKIISPEKTASVENVERKRVIVYEMREIYLNSINYALDNLGVEHTKVKSCAELYAELEQKEYNFIFISYALFKNGKTRLMKERGDAKIVVLAEFGETPADENLNILTMPVHSISIANVLNGVSNICFSNTADEALLGFIAPEARILIVDDINTNLKVAEGLLAPYQMQIDLRKSGKEAVAAVKDVHYDLVFIDHMMPEMDGIEATLQIRALDGHHYKNVPIVALTANAVSGVKEMFMANGFNDFLPKPIDMVKLNSILEKWIPKEKHEKPTAQTGAGELASFPYNLTIKGVDVDKGVFMTGGAMKNYLQTLAVFCKDGVEKTAQIKTSLQEYNLSLYTTHVHALKSAAASIGADNISERAAALEAAGNEGRFAFIQENTYQFLMDLDILLHNIREAIAPYASDSSIDMNVLKSELSRLAAALEAFDLDVIDQSVNVLQGFTHDTSMGVAVDAILQDVLIGDYDQAVSSINGLLDGDLKE
jgi:CheY-like chemotaxis protein